jgi:glycosyltransferase involved in cell wall biosynthesis
MALYFLVSRLFRIAYMQEKSEYPFVLNRKTYFGKLYAKIYVSCFYKFFDGMIVMTKPLMDYFTPLVRKDARLLHVPMTVEPERFHSGEKRDYVSDYIAYCGDMSGNKDGVPILVEAFGIIAGKYPAMKLYLIGPTGSDDERRHLADKIDRLGLKDRVVLVGRISREEMPEYLDNARILALARPSGLQSAGGFPTKLGEYLCTGNPVVLTRVGEIPLYLEHRVHAFLSQPDDPKAFADQMDAALSDPVLAARVGQEGRALALRTFDYRIQSGRMVEFFNSFSHTLGG